MMEPVAWRIKDFADGSFFLENKESAENYEEMYGASVTPLVTLSSAQSEIDKRDARIAELEETRAEEWRKRREAEGERAKVEFRDNRMFNFHAEEGELLFEIPRHIAVSIDPDGVGYTIFDAKADCWKAGRYEVCKDIVNAGAEISAAIRALKEKP